MNNRNWPRDRGSVLALAALMLVVIVGCLALAVDLMHLYLVKCELQRAADAGAQAGALGLFDLPAAGSSLAARTPDCTRALNHVQTVVTANQADGKALELLSEDVVFGKWDSSLGTFVVTGCAEPAKVNALQVTVRKDGSVNGPVTLSFAGVLPGAFKGASLAARAVGMVGFPGQVPAGLHLFPLAIDVNKAPPLHGGDPILIGISHASGDNGAWTTFDGSPGASSTSGLVDGTIPSPAVKVGDSITVMNGVADSVLQEVARQWSRLAPNYIVLAPVISGETHNGATQVLGFVAFRITSVTAHGTDKYLTGVTVPNYIAPGVLPGGPNYGLWAGVVKLVE